MAERKMTDKEVDALIEDVFAVFEDATKQTVYGSEYDPEKDRKVSDAIDRLERFRAGDPSAYNDEAERSRP